jgi:putative toxin-antitoxin system antitoxin component (TIGR02293 family)
MKPEMKKKLEKAGWRIGSAEDFLTPKTHRVRAASSALREPRKKLARLSSKDREKLARVTQIQRQARKIFSTNKAVSKWLISPALALEGAVPIDLLDTDQGAKDVEAVLKGIAHGNVM